LSFVARRLLADRVGMVFAVQEASTAQPRLQALPSLRLVGLPDLDARELLQGSAGHPVEAGVVERIVTETCGNPLAVIEAVRELTSEQLAGRASLPQPLPIGHRLDALFLRQFADLPADTRTLLLLAAVAHTGRSANLWRAAAALGIPESAALPAEGTGLVAFWPRIRFAQPLIRSAIYHSAPAGQRRRAHRAVAAACDPEVDADARSWHLAAAAAGPDELVAAEQEAAAERARSRGGFAATAALLERAALLTPDRKRRAERQLSAAEAHLLAGAVDRAGILVTEAVAGLDGPCAAAHAARLVGRIHLARGSMAEAADALVGAARQLGPHDPQSATEALLSALEAVVFAGWAASAARLQEIAGTARDLPPSEPAPGAAADLLLEGYMARITAGYAAAVPALRRAVEVFLADDVDPDVALRRLELAAVTAGDLLDDVATERLTRTWIGRARSTGALTRLANALAFRSAFVDGPRGQLVAARAAETEARDLATVTHNPGVVPVSGAHTVLTLALGGQEAEARATAAAVAREAPSRGAVGEAAFAASALGVLEISLGHYESAVDRLQAAYGDDTPLVGTRSLPDLVEAAVRADRPDVAADALLRFQERATATGTPLAMGLLARSRAVTAPPPEAEQHYADAVDILGGTLAGPETARAQLLYGEWLRRQRRRREAREQLRAAHDRFEALGLRAFADRAGAELRLTGERARGREIGAPERLTPQEAQISVLVSRGESNRDIATQLFLSPSTVEYHLRKVFRKLDVTSRTQLARRLLDDGADAPGFGDPPEHLLREEVG
jgi:DNA-binding CsgD family transcriptional regulator/tetratricopeptide (TPR) repeat protein